VLHTTEILNALFEIASTVTVGISGYVGSGEVNTTVDIENAIAALPGGIGNMPVALELMVVGWMLRLVNIVVNTIVASCMCTMRWRRSPWRRSAIRNCTVWR
jgi:hypothetical protein